MLTTPVFRPWRALWDAQLAALTPRLDQLAILRQKGRQVPPLVVDCDVVLFSRAICALSEPPHSPEFLEKSVKPLLKACVWPRWLLLEEAFDHAARSGDLHLSALTLRTQIEELDVLRIAASVLVPRNGDGWSDDAIGDAIRTLQTRILPRSESKDQKRLMEQASDKVLADLRPKQLQQAFDQLSEYVHPNYGSHVLSVRPHSIEAAKVLALMEN